MLAFIARRMVHSLFVILAITIVIFFLIRLTGDPVAVMFQSGEPTAEAMQELREQLGLDEPIYVQLGLYIKDMLTGNFGTSFRTGESVFSMIMDRMEATLLLACGGMVSALLIALPVGIWSAVRRGSLFDYFGRIFALIGISFPNFWLGIMLIIIFAVQLQWFPASGYQGWEYLVLPSISLGLIMSGILARLIRSSMLEVLNQQYITTARSKGIKEWVVIIKHALRNALIPTITVVGLSFGSLLGGAVVTETIFSWPGMGKYVVESIAFLDFPAIMGFTFLISLGYVVINLIVDLTYYALDPQIKE